MIVKQIVSGSNESAGVPFRSCILEFVSAYKIKGFEYRLLTIIPIIGSVRGAFQILGISETT